MLKNFIILFFTLLPAISIGQVVNGNIHYEYTVRDMEWTQGVEILDGGTDPAWRFKINTPPVTCDESNWTNYDNCDDFSSKGPHHSTLFINNTAPAADNLFLQIKGHENDNPFFGSDPDGCAEDGDDDGAECTSLSGPLAFGDPGTWNDSPQTASNFTWTMRRGWSYENGDNSSSALDFGTLNFNDSWSHFNSNLFLQSHVDLPGWDMGYSNQYMGQGSKDVFYKFTISDLKKVTLSTINVKTDPDFDTYLSLLSASTGALLKSNDDCCVEGLRQSKISEHLCPGTYYIVVEGFDMDEGVFQLDLTIADPDNNLIQPGSISTSVSAVCQNAAFPDIDNEISPVIGILGGSEEYIWELSSDNGNSYTPFETSTLPNLSNSNTTLPTKSFWLRRKTRVCGYTSLPSNELFIQIIDQTPIASCPATVTSQSLSDMDLNNILPFCFDRGPIGDGPLVSKGKWFTYNAIGTSANVSINNASASPGVYIYKNRNGLCDFNSNSDLVDCIITQSGNIPNNLSDDINISFNTKSGETYFILVTNADDQQTGMTFNLTLNCTTTCVDKAILSSHHYLPSEYVAKQFILTDGANKILSNQNVQLVGANVSGISVFNELTVENNGQLTLSVDGCN